MRKRLLVVDGEPRSRRVLDVNLRGAGFDVQTASDGTQAWSLLEAATPDLIVCDADSADADAFALCARVRGSATASQVPFLLLSASRAREQKIRALEAGADDFLVKPAYLKEILARVRALLQRRERDDLATGGVEVQIDALPEPSGRAGAAPFSGDLAEISVVDLVQLVEHNGRSGIIHVRGPTGAPAFVYFRRGRVIDAEAGRLSGLDALARLFSWSTGTFEIEWKNIRRNDVIHRPLSELVLDGMQRLDAWNELRGELGDPRAVFEVDYRLLAERLAEIPDEVNSILRLCDGVRTVLQVVEESPLSDTEALTALLRLREEGIVYDKTLPPSSSEGRSARGRSEGWSGLGQEPMTAAVPRSGPRSSDTSGPVEQSAGHRRDDGAVQPPESPRRTAPGLGQPTPSTEDDAPEPVPGRRANGDGGAQSNVIQFPVPLGSAAAVPAPRAERAGPTVVGFVPVTAGLAPDVTTGAEAASSDAAAATDAHPLSLTLPLGRAQEVAALREQVLREQSAPTAASSLAPVEDASPQALGSMADTHRGFGPSPSAQDHEASPAAGVPVEVVESTSGPPIPSGPISAPTSGRGPGQSGRVRPLAAEGTAPSAAVSGETSTRSAASAPTAGPIVPPPSDATAKVSFTDPDISRHDALDELGLPSRWRGFRVMVGALALGAAAAFGAHRFLEARRGDDQAPAASVDASGPAVPAPSGAVVVPVTEPRPAPSAPPAVELPAPSAPAGSPGASPPSAAATSPSVHGAPVPAEPAEPPAPVPAAAVPAAPGPSDAPPAKAAPETAGGGAGESTPVAGGKELSNCRAAFARNRLREALVACTAAAAANPRSAAALTMLAHTELNRGRLARANELAEKAIAIDPGQADAYVIIGGVHQDSGQNREAKAAYRRYLELAPRGRYADELRSIVNGL